jgi:WhiB family redox-sensing transcriptional regulator
MASDTSWRDDAACRPYPDLFYGPDDEADAAREARETRARAICAGCPVQSDCLLDALTHGTPAGIWAGLSEIERRRYHRQAGRARAAAAKAAL